MDDLYEPDYGCAFYRSKDPIKNLCVRVVLERVTSASIVPQATEDNGDDLQLRNVDSQESAQRNSEEYTFKWQEKLFCQREVDLYSNENCCVTVLEKKYHKDASLLREVGRPTSRLFSYVDHDSFTNQDENFRTFTSSPNEEKTPLGEKMTNLRYRRTAGAKSKDGKPLLPKTNLVDYEPTEESRKQNHLLSTPVQTMYIMADLTPPSRDVSTEDEFVLCTIKVDANGVMSIKPDFNKGRKAYKVEASGMGRDLYQYTIEHASRQLSRQEQDREAKILRDLCQKHADYLTACVGHEFEMPPPDVLRNLVYGEIVLAKNFEYDDLYIHYFVELPTGWYADGLQQLSGVTQTCATRVEGRDNVAYFSFPFNFEINYKSDPLKANTDEEMPRWPLLYLEVLSLDAWQRHRTEGYGYLMLPPSAGMTTHVVKCWRPLGRSCFSELRRFFIGGSPELEDPTYVAIPSTFESSRLSKFGFRTMSTGSVTVKFSVLQQSQAFLRSASSKKKVGTIREKLGFAAGQGNILGILDAFQKAKQKMVAARENLKHDFIETIHPEESET